MCTDTYVSSMAGRLEQDMQMYAGRSVYSVRMAPCCEHKAEAACWCSRVKSFITSLNPESYLHYVSIPSSYLTVKLLNQLGQ
jgi:hypothetical protein